MKTKNILYPIIAIVMAVFTFTSCEDVPEPYMIPGGSTGNEPTITEPAGDGTMETPYNVAGIIKYIQNSETLTDKVYIKGKISQIKEINTENFGNATFYISDTGNTSNEFYVYRCMGLNNGKFQSTDEIKIGDEVVIYGNVTIYNGTYETEANKAYVYSINGNTGTGGGDVTGANLLTNGDFETWNGNVPASWNGVAGNTDLAQSSDAHGGSYSVSVGFDATLNKRISYNELNLKPGTYKFSFYAKSTTADASQCRPGYAIVTNGSVSGADAYQYGNYASLSNSSWTLVENTFTIESTTTVCLIVMNPKTSSYATAQNILIDDASLVTSDGGIDGSTGGGENPGTGTETPVSDKATITKEGTVVTMVNPNTTESTTTITCDLNTCGFVDKTTPTEVTLDDGTKISFSQEGGNNNPVYYEATKGIRMYALNAMTVTGSKPIAKIVLTCDSYSGTDYIGNDQLYTNISGNTWKVVNDWEKNSGGTQLRVQTVTITYAN